MEISKTFMTLYINGFSKLLYPESLPLEEIL